MSIGLSTILLFGGLLFLLAMGVPVVFALGGISVLITFLLDGTNGLYNAGVGARAPRPASAEGPKSASSRRLPAEIRFSAELAEDRLPSRRFSRNLNAVTGLDTRNAW